MQSFFNPLKNDSKTEINTNHSDLLKDIEATLSKIFEVFIPGFTSLHVWESGDMFSDRYIINTCQISLQYNYEMDIKTGKLNISGEKTSLATLQTLWKYLDALKEYKAYFNNNINEFKNDSWSMYADQYDYSKDKTIKDYNAQLEILEPLFATYEDKLTHYLKTLINKMGFLNSTNFNIAVLFGSKTSSGGVSSLYDISTKNILKKLNDAHLAILENCEANSKAEYKQP